MKISSTSGNNFQHQPRSKADPTKGVDFLTTMNDSEATPILNVRDITAKYDLRNISFNEIQQLGGELHKAGFLSIEEVADLEASALPVPDFLSGIRANDRVDRFDLVQRDLEYSRQHQSSDKNTIASLERTKAVFDRVRSLWSSIDLKG